MITDDKATFSRDQAVTADAASTDYYDAGAATDLGAGEPIGLWARVTEAFNNLTSLGILLQSDDNASFSSATTHWTKTVLLASLTLDAAIALPPIPPGTRERYWRLYYDVTGTAPTTGKIDAGVARDKPARPDLTY